MGEFFNHLRSDEKPLVERLTELLVAADQAIHEQEGIPFNAATWTEETQEKLAHQMFLLTYRKFEATFGSYESLPKGPAPDENVDEWYKKNEAYLRRLTRTMETSEATVPQRIKQMYEGIISVTRKSRKNEDESEKANEELSENKTDPSKGDNGPHTSRFRKDIEPDKGLTP